MDITVTDLCKSFGGESVLDNFSAVFPEGRLTCIMGPSGCGKTTLLNILMGLLKPDSGSVSGMPARKSAVFQEDRLCESFTAAANIRFVCGAQPRTINDMLSSIGISDGLDKPVGEFSGGMKRRVALARALLADWDVLFMDEPFKGLDEGTKASVLRCVAEHIAGRTVIMVTHDPEEVAVLGGGLLLMEKKGLVVK